MNMREKFHSRLNSWREKYSSFVIALVCLCSAYVSWGGNWVLTGVLVTGVLVCGSIGFHDIKRSRKQSS
ncbi:hypothetical protein FZC79_18195 [Rossellomorea vietnamensis]|uniref:Uncharacterized protein n=1 Tax=Rossellomorea vietnamensis TaxID=218284 RepID=A0A5D4K8F9_9BACI|nr:hypothetical protein FZC79_18195 [Rossellomorea vietnamensis]